MALVRLPAMGPPRAGAAPWFFLRYKRVVALTIALWACLLSGCATIYKPAPFWGASGYSSRNIDATTVEVNYLTGTGADRSTARDYAMHRCAEITLERGFNGFFVLNANAFSTPGQYGTTTSSTITMRMYKGEPPDRGAWPAGAVGAYDSRAEISRLKRWIKR